MGLQGFLMMDGKDMGFKLPKELSKIPNCLRKILWESEEESDNGLCARIPGELRSKFKELMMMILKREISPKFVKINWPQLMDSLGDSELVEALVKNILSKAMVPVKESDISEVLALVKDLWKTVVDGEKDPENKAILNLVTDLIRTLENPNIVSILTEVVREIQEMAALKKGLPMLEGEMGRAPDDRLLGERYVRSLVAGGGGGGGETVFVRAGGGVVRGEWCPVTGAWYWTRL